MQKVTEVENMTESKSQRKTVLNMYELGEVLARTEQKETIIRVLTLPLIKKMVLTLV